MYSTIRLFLIFLFLSACHTGTMSQTITIEAEDMTPDGPYAGPTDSPFSGMAFYANGDCAEKTCSFPTGSGKWQASITGCSNNGNAAGI
ncbi:MAG: hypothetical protein ACI4TW_08675, partial [Prevotella sp.]